MKITIKIDSDTLFLLKACFDLYRKNDLSHAKSRHEKSDMYLFFELRKIFELKAVSLDRTDKKFRMTSPYYLANKLYDFICHMLQFNEAFGIYERNKIEFLRNDLHQKLL